MWGLPLLLPRTWFKVACADILCTKQLQPEWRPNPTWNRNHQHPHHCNCQNNSVNKMRGKLWSLFLSEQWKSGACGRAEEGELREFSIDRHHRAKRRNGRRSSWTSDLWKGNKCSLATIRLIFYIRKELCKGEWKYLQDFCFGSGKPREEQVCTGYSSERLRVGYRW